MNELLVMFDLFETYVLRWYYLAKQMALAC